MSVRQREENSLIVTTAADVVNPFDGVTSLREAVAYAESFDKEQTITFNDDFEIILDSPLSVSKSLTISGKEHNITINGSEDTHLLTFSGTSSDTLTFDTLSLSTNYNGTDAAILSLNGSGETIKLNNVQIEKNGTNAWKLDNSYFYLSNNSSVWNVEVLGSGIVKIDKSSTLDGFTIQGNKWHRGGGDLEVSGFLKNAVIKDLGDIYLNDGSSAENITIESNGFLQSVNASVKDLSIEYGGIYFYSVGSSLDGVITISGAMRAISSTNDQIVKDSAKVVFDLHERNENSNFNFYHNSHSYAQNINMNLMVDSYSALQNADSYTISVSAEQSAGTYRLVGNAASFQNNVSLTVDGTSYLNVLSIGKEYVLNNKTYSLQLNSANELVLNIDYKKESPSLVVTTAEDIVDDTDGLISLREAVAYANNGTRAEDGTATITFDESLGKEFNIAWDTELGHIEITSGIYSNETLIIDGEDRVSITGGESSDGVFLIRSNNLVNIKNLSFSNHKDGTVIFNQGTLLAEGIKISDSSTGYCAGIWTQDGTSTINNCTFINDSATENSGAVRNERGTVTINDSYFYNNHADRNGGAIHNVFYGANMTIKNTVFEDNSASTGGGAIYNFSYANLNLDGCSFIGNQSSYGYSVWNGSCASTISENSNFYENNTDAVLAFSVSNETVSVTGNTLSAQWNDPDNVSHVIKIDDEIIELNTPCYSSILATGEHEIYVGHRDCSNNYAWSKKYTITASYERFVVDKDNSSEENPYKLAEDGVYTNPETSSENGGAGIVKSEGFLSASNITFKENSAYQSGGAICNGGMMVLKNVEFSTNSSVSSGGALLNDHGSIYLEDADFNGNHSYYGGAIYNDHGETEISKASFTDNAATEGTVSNFFGSINITETSFTNNSAENYGGAIRNWKGSITVTDTIFSGNAAQANGGVIDNVGQATFSSSIFENNSAVDGGVIANYRGGMILEDVSFSNNKATKGGGIINYCDMTLDHTIFSGNSASYGGALYNNNGGVMTLSNISFNGNTAKESGGAIYNNSRINIVGAVDLKTESDTWVNCGTQTNEVITNWDLSDEESSETVCLNNYQYFSNQEYAKQTITVQAAQTVGIYTIATGDFSVLDGKNTFTLKTSDDVGVLLTVNGNMTVYNNLYYELTIDNNSTEDILTDDLLILSVSSDKEVATPKINHIMNDGYISEISWSNTANKVDFAIFQKGNPDSKQIVRTEKQSIDVYAAPEYISVSLKNTENTAWSNSKTIETNQTGKATEIISNKNGNGDIFFVNITGTWNTNYQAYHDGLFNGWKGTHEGFDLNGKNQITDVFEGSTDANILLMTDDENGDALFVDDIYSAFPDDQQARIAQIDEIRAGAGDDIVDMTSQRFEYEGDGLSIRGGDGNDTVWANLGDNKLFGDSGNDRIVGASGNDVIAGGSGNDSMHGGGGNDTFCFCENWGSDTVEQLSDGTITLWFADNNVKWDAEKQVYTDGVNTVKVVGSATVNLKYGDDDSEQYDELVSSGAFMETSSQKIFEEENKGVIASL